MGHRTQITLVERERRLNLSFGAWAEVAFDGEEAGPLDALDGAVYVERLRQRSPAGRID